MLYMIIAPYDSQDAERFEQAWSFDLKNGTIAMGWTELGDISKLSRSELEQHFRRTYPAKSKGVTTRELNSLWSFYHETTVGDVVLARRGRSRLVGIGTVQGSAFYDTTKGRERVTTGPLYANFLPVRWEQRDIDYGRQMFAIGTIYTINREKFEALTSGIVPAGVDPDEPMPAVESAEAIEFALEKHLEDFMIQNFESIFGKELRLFTDESGGLGQQYPTIDEEGAESGRIDILAIDPTTSDYVVIELKKGRESDKVVGQILRYISWVRDNLCTSGQNVRGIVICSRADKKLQAAIKPVAHLITVKQYKVDFQLLDP
jgi:restriction system protein